MPSKDKYTDPELRDQVKKDVQDSDKGGAPGQWSARKAQFMASEYKKRGGGYNTDKSQQDESQKHLSKWTEEEWQTKEGSANAKQNDGTQKRYLPKEAWENMSENEKQETEQKKEEGSKEGNQFVQNTSKAKQSRQKAIKNEDQRYEQKKAKDRNGGADDKDDEFEDEGKGDESEEDHEDEVETDEEGSYDGDKDEFQDDDDVEADEPEDEENDVPKASQKRKQGDGQETNGASKKQKSDGDSGNAPKGKVGSKHMDAEEPAPRGSADRLPKPGSAITWKAMPGYVDGQVTEVLTSGKKVYGKDVKASKKDPRIVMKSNSSGKTCVHKPEACFYESDEKGMRR